MDTEVNYEIAKLLAEKGFLQNNIDYETISTIGKDDNNDLVFGETYACPNISQVIMWLYKKHKIWISVYQHKDHAADVNDKPTFRTNFTHSEDFNSPTEAYEVSILRILKYLI